MRESRSTMLAWALFATSIVLSIGLSAQGLLALGIPYDAPYGPVVAKIHPGSYTLVLAWLAALSSRGNPLRAMLRQFRELPLVTLYFAGMVTVFCWVILRHGTSGAAYIIQTLWMPAIAVFTMRLLSPARHRQTLWLIMALVAVNDVVALAEYALKAHLIPIPIEQIGNDYFRSSAFLGHPLLNANVSMALLPAITMLPLRTSAKVALALTMVASVLAFGARSALVVGVLIYGSCLIAAGTHNLIRGRYTYLQITGTAVALMAGLAAMAGVVAATGLGERIFQNLVWDNSASVRTRVWQAFDFLSETGWWFGIAPLEIDKIALNMGLDPRFESIENFWIYAFLQFGAIGYVPFIVGLGCLTVYMMRQATPAMRVGIVLFYVVASTANALSSKTISLTLLAIVATAGAAVAQRLPLPPRPRATHRSAPGLVVPLAAGLRR